MFKPVRKRLPSLSFSLFVWFRFEYQGFNSILNFHLYFCSLPALVSVERTSVKSFLVIFVFDVLFQHCDV